VEHLVPITFFAGLFTWLIARNRYRTQEKLQLAAINHGLSALPASEPRDRRITAAVLIALGIGFAVASYVSLSLSPAADIVSPLAVSIWAIIPILVGAALWRSSRPVSPSRS
jgi:hypothetical protein